MGKSNIFQESNEGEEALTNLIKKLVTQAKPGKPKQKRVISEERKEQLRQQLLKGRENSIKSRSKVNKEMQKKEEEVNKPAPPPPSNSPAKFPEFNALHSKIDDLVTHMKEVTSLQKEHLEYKKKKKNKNESDDKEKSDEVVLFKPKKKEEKQEVKQEQAIPQITKYTSNLPQIPQKITPSYYYIPTTRNSTLF